MKPGIVSSTNADASRHILLVDIRTYPSTSNMGPVKKRTRVAESSAVLTSSLYKDKLALNVVKPSKINKPSKKRKQCKPRKRAKKPRRSKHFVKKGEQDCTVFCSYSTEAFEDPLDQGWLSFTKCGSWSHELCAPLESNEDFFCVLNVCN